jgi:UDP-3-O-[3-hydroxymyristoyl] N-acetylglucosamine deacetylase
MLYEKTIKTAVTFDGVGLHSGRPVSMKLVSAPEGTGIVFRRIDLGSFLIPVREAEVLSTSYSTTIGMGGVQVRTVEHLLAALYALGIDNLFVDLDSEEVPIADGSAAPFITLLRNAGIVVQGRAKAIIEITEPITITEAREDDGEKSIRIVPADAFELSYTIRFNHPLILSQSYTYQHTEERFIREIAPARTFGFLKDIKRLLETGLVRGGSLENAVVVGEDKILNQEGLRFPNEFVRHKILDLMGDLALIGMPILGRVEAHHSGHKLHTQLIDLLRKNKGAFRIVSSDSEKQAPALALTAR